ncbi:MotA/TolQ/ExbB proton channel family protein [Rhodobacteraceae bacterium CCMM004]|nr:MotA/TolQ/ExbB proton channel family protein [Rhodobacteraceae bacterium CCMM004]
MDGGLVATLQSGGPIVALLIVLSLFSLALIAVKLRDLSGVFGGAERRAQALRLWSQGDRSGAIGALDDGSAPTDRVLREAMAGLAAGQPRAVLDTDLEWRGNAEVAALSRHLPTLELIAMVSPLLGLLGTVLGMIQAFRELALAEGAANASILASGIWQALLTTAAGLIVAIPAAVAATLLAARVERAGQAMEAAVGQLFALEDGRR